MKKRLLSLALCGALLCGALAGCGGNETTSASQEPSSSQAAEESKILTTAVGAELNTLYPLNMDVQNNIGTKLCYEGLVNSSPAVNKADCDKGGKYVGQADNIA